MEIEVIVRTGNGDLSTFEEVFATKEQAFCIAESMGGSVIYGRGMPDGTKLIVNQ